SSLTSYFCLLSCIVLIPPSFRPVSCGSISPSSPSSLMIICSGATLGKSLASPLREPSQPDALDEHRLPGGGNTLLESHDSLLPIVVEVDDGATAQESRRIIRVGRDDGHPVL